MTYYLHDYDDYEIRAVLIATLGYESDVFLSWKFYVVSFGSTVV